MVEPTELQEAIIKASTVKKSMIIRMEVHTMEEPVVQSILEEEIPLELALQQQKVELLQVLE